MDRRLTFLFAVTAGAAVGNLYWAQPLLDVIAEDLGASTTGAGWLVTATQVGYAVGVLFVVPLGDILDRRRLVPAMLLCSAVALLFCALAPTIGLLLAAVTLVGLTTVSGQLLTPLASDLAPPERRGQVVGVVASGILTGILASRTVSGLVADAAGWRAIFAMAAVVAVLFAVLLFRALPPLKPKAHLPYPALIASVATVAFRERTVRWTLVLGATGFAAFSMFWTALTFLLSAPPFSYPVSVIGLFGLAGLASVIAAQRAGSLHDRGWSLPATGAAWLLVLVAFVVAGFAGRSVTLVLVVVVALDAALQTLAILNQTRVFAVSHEARSRINTAYVVSNFVGAALGSAAATTLWTAGGWSAVTTTGVVLSCFALTVWAAGRRSALVVATATR
ncbi:Predicted arabinose efflux permease, MFS family [Asanoa ishikariensis]|uniref:Predicted arabinose efflux permease, MFS family n=2 Tax=Asanoa ishikariensis TaxID=137265 RepID=A0A1H3P2G2_9ACTN|nr:Predicted arabinose efflux permease, MFS family [Asanoa ishikariensis]